MSQNVVEIEPNPWNASLNDQHLTQQPPRPPLVRRGTSYASQPGTNPGTTRLLWRGSIVTRQGYKLYGIAIIAHLFSVPSSTTSTTTTPTLSPSNSFSPFDDPFSSSSKATNSGADMCLGLEMLRGRDLSIIDDDDGTGIIVEHLERGGGGTDSEASSPELVRKGQSAKQRGKLKEENVLKVETPTDVRVYVDERCPDTVEWFEDQFCREGCQGKGIKLDAGGEQIVIFAQQPLSRDTSLTTANNSPSSSTATELPPLTLLLGRPFKPVVRKPRPDDPLPRESLFTAKLRKTASLPATAFSKTSLTSTSENFPDSFTSFPLPKEKKKRLTSKDKSILTLMGKPSSSSSSTSLSILEEELSSRPRVPQRRQSSIPPLNSTTFPLPGTGGGGTKRTLSRSFSTSAAIGGAGTSSSRLFSTSTRQESLPPFSTTTSTGRPFKRSRSSLPPTISNGFLGTGSPPPLPALGRDDTRRRSISRAPPSPTLSVASTSFGGGGGGSGIKEDDFFEGQEEEREGDQEVQDRLEELRSIGIKRERSTNGFGPIGGGGARGAMAMGMKRSLSVPVGAGGGGKFLASNGTIEGGSRREEKRVKVEEGGELGAIEVRNKNTVKKLTSNALQSLGIGKEHEEFKDLFSMVSRGVGFALRASFKARVLSPIERSQAEELVQVHLRLYLPDHPNFCAFEEDALGKGVAGGGRGERETTVEGDNLSRGTKTWEDLGSVVVEPGKAGPIPIISKEEGVELRPSTNQDAQVVKEGSSDTVVGDESDSRDRKRT